MIKSLINMIIAMIFMMFFVQMYPQAPQGLNVIAGLLIFSLNEMRDLIRSLKPEEKSDEKQEN